jgi:hypothetical protein
VARANGTVPRLSVAPGRKGFKAELEEMREQMRGLGLGHGQIAGEIARRYRLRPREAFRLAHGWTLGQAAAQFNARAADLGTDPGGLASLAGNRLCEYEKWSHSERRPSVYVLVMLAHIYQAGVLDLLDLADHEHLPPRNRLTLLQPGQTAGAVTIAVGVLFYHGHVTAAEAGAMLIAMILGALAWAAAATAITGLIPTAESANPVFMLVYFPVVFISGALGATSVLPHWLTTLASYLPAQPMVGALTSSLRHSAGGPFLPGRDVAVLVAWAVAGLVAAVILFRWEPHRLAVKRPARARA